MQPIGSNSPESGVPKITAALTAVVCFFFLGLPVVEAHAEVIDLWVHYICPLKTSHGPIVSAYLEQTQWKKKTPGLVVVGCPMSVKKNRTGERDFGDAGERD